MNIISGTTEFKIPDKTVVTLGKFDGIHNGHLLILNRMSEYKKRGLKTCVMTFDIPPASLGFGSDQEVLMMKSEKEQVLRKYDIDYLIEFPFYEKTASIGAQQFIEEFIVDRMNAKAVVVGVDCTFGHMAKGNADMLKDYGPIYDFEVTVLDRVKDGDIDLSSTYIRSLVREGKVDKADSLSFRPFFINGRFRRGSTEFSSGLLFYFVDVPEGKVMPCSGLYYSKIWYEECFYPALTRVDKDKRELMTYVYGGVKGIARGEVSVALFERKRDLLVGASAEEQDKQARQDIFDGQKWHKEHPRD